MFCNHVCHRTRFSKQNTRHARLIYKLITSPISMYGVAVGSPERRLQTIYQPTVRSVREISNWVLAALTERLRCQSQVTQALSSYLMLYTWLRI